MFDSDNETEYFRRPYQDYTNNNKYYYSGYSSYQNAQNPFHNDSRRYGYNAYPNDQNGGIPPYEPGNHYYNTYGQRNQYDAYQQPPQPQYYPQGYQGYESGYPGYPSYSQPTQYSQIPPYKPEMESRRNVNTGGVLNTSLFNDYQGYSAPINNPVRERRAPVPSYTGPMPVNGFANMYTQPPVPRDPQIQWSQYGKSGYQAASIPPDSMSVTATWNKPTAGPESVSWLETFDRNFGDSKL